MICYVLCHARVREKRRDRSSKCSQWPELTLFRVSHIGAIAQRMKSLSTAFSGCKQGIGSKVEQLGHEPVHIWDADACGWG